MARARTESEVCGTLDILQGRKPPFAYIPSPPLLLPHEQDIELYRVNNPTKGPTLMEWLDVHYHLWIRYSFERGRAVRLPL